MVEVGAHVVVVGVAQSVVEERALLVVVGVAGSVVEVIESWRW